MVACFCLDCLAAALEAHAAGWKESAKDFRDACDLLTEERDGERARADAAAEQLQLHIATAEQLRDRMERAESFGRQYKNERDDAREKRKEAEVRLAELERHLGSLERLNGVNAQFGAAGIADMQRQRDDALARADALERELDEANEREQVASSCFAEARADLQQARQQIIREHTASRYAAGWRAGRDAAAHVVDGYIEAVEIGNEGTLEQLINAIRALEPPGGES